MSQPFALQWQLLWHNCCPPALSSHSAFCPDLWALLHGIRWSLRKGWPATNSPLLLLLQGALDTCGSFSVPPIYPSDLHVSDLWKLLCIDHSLRLACMQVRYYLLRFRCLAYCFSKGEIWGDPLLHHASDVILRSILICIQDVQFRLRFNFWPMDVQLFYHHLLKHTTLSSLNLVWIFVKNQLAVLVWGYFWAI